MAGAPNVIAAPSQNHANADIMVVVDLSGSMKSTDDEDRFAGFFMWTNSFVESGDRIGVVAMGNGARLIAPLTPKSDFSLEAIAEQLDHRSKYTDVAAGLENAYYELKNNTRKDAVKIILLFSDAQIDMPKGMWDLENSMRYLQTSLIPAMKTEQIRLMSIVPDGLKANFPLLQELANGTGGAYYRGLPKDAVAVRQYSPEPATVSQPIEAATAPSPALSAAPTIPTVKKTRSTVAASASGNQAAPSVPQSKSEFSISLPIIVIAAVALVGLIAAFLAIFVLFRRTAPSSIGTDDELAGVLQDLQALKAEAAASPSNPQLLDAELDDDEPDFGEPKDQLSVSMVAPFLDYAETRHVMRRKPTDEIAVKPAFSTEESQDSSLSVTNMETLIGTVAPQVDDK